MAGAASQEVGRVICIVVVNAVVALPVYIFLDDHLFHVEEHRHRHLIGAAITTALLSPTYVAIYFLEKRRRLHDV